MALNEQIKGKNKDRMPDWSFRMMTSAFRIIDLFRNPAHFLNEFDIEPGMTIVDYGCGPGRYVPKASALVGPKGKVIAADVHELAITSVKRQIKKWKLNNVETALIKNNKAPIPDQSADMIYALDMFHMVSHPGEFFNELQRIIKPSGVLILEDGHQPRNESKAKLAKSGLWNIIEENNRYMKCKVAVDY
jgi:ubiquinone/menaquinone biosynthesis C-methylase UbiE